MDDDDLTNFIAITGVSEAQARSMLEAHSHKPVTVQQVSGGDLEQAVQLFFAAETGGGFEAPPVLDDEAFARSLARPDAVPTGSEEEVRAPIPITTSRLVEDYPASVQQPRRPRSQQPSNTAFRDARAPMDSGGTTGPSNAVPSLQSLFENPKDILFSGTFDEAKGAALGQARWLLVNVQSDREFASHQLNRDTWRDDAVKSIIQGSFIFWQVWVNMPEGEEFLCKYPRLGELPAILAVDPVTGALVRQWHGFLEPNRLMEELVPLMDHDINDPKAGQLAASHHKRKHAQAAAPQGRSAATEDEELALALATSMEQTGGGVPPPSAVASSSSFAEAVPKASRSSRTGPADQLQAGAVGASSAPAAAAAVEHQLPPSPQLEPQPPPLPAGSVEEAQAAAAAAVPPEPEAGDKSGCRIAIRLPTGQRGQRRFPRSAPLGAVRSYCITQVPEAAAGRPFRLLQAFPGAPELTDMSATLEASGAADGLLVMQWS